MPVSCNVTEVLVITEAPWVEGTKLVHDVGGGVGRPFLADSAVGDPVDIDRVPVNLTATGGYAQQVALVRRGNHESQHDQVALRR